MCDSKLHPIAEFCAILCGKRLDCNEIKLIALLNTSSLLFAWSELDSMVEDETAVFYWLSCENYEAQCDSSVKQYSSSHRASEFGVMYSGIIIFGPQSRCVSDRINVLREPRFCDTVKASQYIYQNPEIWKCIDEAEVTGGFDTGCPVMSWERIQWLKFYRLFFINYRIDQRINAFLFSKNCCAFPVGPT